MESLISGIQVIVVDGIDQDLKIQTEKGVTETEVIGRTVIDREGKRVTVGNMLAQYVQ